MRPSWATCAQTTGTTDFRCQHGDADCRSPSEVSAESGVETEIGHPGRDPAPRHKSWLARGFGQRERLFPTILSFDFYRRHLTCSFARRSPVGGIGTPQVRKSVMTRFLRPWVRLLGVCLALGTPLQQSAAAEDFREQVAPILERTA